MITQSAWIWTTGKPAGKNSYAAFRHTFEVTADYSDALLQIAADSNFTVWINGKRVPGNQFPDFPAERTYSTLPVGSYLQPGRNTIAVRVHYIGEEFATYTAGRAGLIAALTAEGKLLSATGKDWKARRDDTFTNGEISKITIQLGYSFCYDARKEDNWQSEEYDDGAWPNAVELATGTEGFWRSLTPRPTEQLLEFPAPEVSVVQTGYLFRAQECATPAETCFADYMRPMYWHEMMQEAETAERGDDAPSRQGKLRDDLTFQETKPLPENTPDNGYYIITDLGRETVGFLKIALRASAGTVVDIAHGEHLQDGRVRSRVGGRNFADRYICKEGENIFLHPLRRIGARYVELHVTGVTRPPCWGYAGVIPVEYPLPEIAAFRTEDHLQNRLHDVAVDTLKLCMHEHYEDCPWREQALYAYDSRNQILYGYYLWGNYPFAAASLDLLGQNVWPEGFLSITAPREQGKLTIPVFTYVWIKELYEYFLHSGDRTLGEKHRGTIRQILAQAWARRDENGLAHTPDAPEIWNFCEWVKGLEKCDIFPQAPLNLYLYEALDAAAKLFDSAEYRKQADELGKRIEETFWNGEAGCYASFCSQDGQWVFHEHTQILMLYLGLVPENKKASVQQSLYDGKSIAVSFSALPYLPGAMMEGNEASRQWCARRLAGLFEPAILQNATSLWETPDGDTAFMYAGSLCHGWSSLPAYFNMRYILGVRPVEPGFRHVEIKPYCARFYEAEGEALTPAGRIRIRWQRHEDGIDLTVEAPEGIRIDTASYPECPVRNCRILRK